MASKEEMKDAENRLPGPGTYKIPKTGGPLEAAGNLPLDVAAVESAKAKVAEGAKLPELSEPERTALTMEKYLVEEAKIKAIWAAAEGPEKPLIVKNYGPFADSQIVFELVHEQVGLYNKHDPATKGLIHIRDLVEFNVTKTATGYEPDYTSPNVMATKKKITRLVEKTGAIRPYVMRGN
jgi:hypothetical protein